jgi:hypothetical protein
LADNKKGVCFVSLRTFIYTNYRYNAREENTRGENMPAPSTPDEEAVFQEFERLFENGEMDTGMIKKISEACNMTSERVGAAILSLIDKDILLVMPSEEEEEELGRERT